MRIIREGLASIDYFRKIVKRTPPSIITLFQRLDEARRDEYLEYKSFIRMNEPVNNGRDPDSSSSGRNRKFRVTREECSFALFSQKFPEKRRCRLLSTGCPRNQESFPLIKICSSFHIIVIFFALVSEHQDEFPFR